MSFFLFVYHSIHVSDLKNLSSFAFWLLEACHKFVAFWLLDVWKPHDIDKVRVAHAWMCYHDIEGVSADGKQINYDTTDWESFPWKPLRENPAETCQNFHCEYSESGTGCRTFKILLKVFCHEKGCKGLEITTLWLWNHVVRVERFSWVVKVLHHSCELWWLMLVTCFCVPSWQLILRRSVAQFILTYFHDM